MAIVKNLFTVYNLLLIVPLVLSATVENNVDELLEMLLGKIESLEVSDAANKAKIAELESDFKMKMSEMEYIHQQKEANMQRQIQELRTTLAKSNGDKLVEQREGNFNTPRTQTVSKNNRRHGDNMGRKREAPEIEVAFYATHSEHDIHHLGANQALLFQQAFTNIGNAYNNNTGAFVAPVDGTYVIHATVMGIDAHSSGHTRAHFDVNGISFSRFWVTYQDQSSQMLVIDLKAGQTVTVRNDQSDEGFVGQHYSTFSGFLLYQHYPSGSLVGK